MAKRFPMAGRYTDFLARLNTYYYNNKAKIKAYSSSPQSVSSEEFDGGGLKDYSSQFESEQKEFGSLKDESWTQKIERNEMKLRHEHESEDQSEPTSPVTHLKNEDTRASTPQSGFTSVNAFDKRKSTSEAPSLPPQSQTWDYASSPNAAPIRSHGMYNPSNEYSEAHSMRPPAAENATISPAYTRGPRTYGSIPPPNDQMNRDQLPSREGGYIHSASQIPWQPQQMLPQQQQQQQQQHMHLQKQLEFEQIKQVGQMSWQNNDLMDFSLCDADGYSNSLLWMQEPVLNSTYAGQYGESFDGTGPSMTTN
jgi:hypothetical protein